MDFRDHTHQDMEPNWPSRREFLPPATIGIPAEAETPSLQTCTDAPSGRLKAAGEFSPRLVTYDFLCKNMFSPSPSFFPLMTTQLLLLFNILLSLVVVCPTATAQQQETSSSPTMIQDALQLQFTPPAPGTYTLPIIDTITDHSLLNPEGERTTLFALTQGKITVLSFMYTTCSEVAGCPLAAAVLQQLDRLLNARPDLAKQVQILSVSFDPERDTPHHLATIRAALAPQTDWQFLTAATAADLQSVLADFNQPVAKLWTPEGEWSGLFRHVLKVYLLDQHHNVRNIYSTGFINAQLILNDIATIMMDTPQRSATGSSP